MSDSISRQMAIDAMISQNGVVDKSVAKRILIQLPSAEPKKGKWIAYKGMQIPERHGLHYCSNCHHSLHLASNGRVYNYCPRCGAKMEVEE